MNSSHRADGRTTLLILGLLGLVVSCDSPEVILHETHRLADLSAAPGPPARATIAGETRFALRAYRRELIHIEEVVPRGRSQLSIEVLLPVELRGRSPLVFEAQVGWLGGSASVHGLAESVRSSGIAEIVLHLPGGDAKRRTVNIYGYAADAVTHTVDRTSEVDIVAGSVLDFGFGVTEAAWAQGGVRFSIAACEGDDCTQIFDELLDPSETAGRSWQDRRVALTAQAGRRVRFRFQARLERPVDGSFTLPSWSNPTLYAPKVRDSDAINIVLLSIDTLRADHLTSYGYERDTAPFIDETLASGGVLFEQFISSATVTGPAHMTMLTSLQPSVHGVREGTDRYLGQLPKNIPSLASHLRSHGFDTAAFTENGAIHRDRGFARGFDTWVQETQHATGAEAGIERTLERGRLWLERHEDRRFFLFLHTYQVHAPYDPPGDYAEMFGEPPRRGLAAKSAHRYDQEIRYVDDAVRAFFLAAAEHRVWRNTIFVVTSDHGEGFAEHGYLGHGPNIHEEGIRIPLILFGPGVASGRRVATPLGLVDLMPTLLELAGVPPLPNLMGRSFAALLRPGAVAKGRDRREIYSEAWTSKGSFLQPGNVRPKEIRVATPTFTLRKGSHKLIRYREEEGFRYEYFDLANDPGERSDLYAGAPQAAAELRGALDQYEETTRRIREELFAEGQEVRAERLDPDVEQKLRALGYLE